VCVAGVGFYLWFMWNSIQKQPEEAKGHDLEAQHEEEDEEPDRPISHGFFYLVVGGLLIILFSEPFINAVVGTAKLFEVNPLLPAFFLAPIASEAPEILESISLSRKGNLQSINIAYSNLVGGTVTKTTLLLGILCFFGVGKELEWSYPSFTISIFMMIFAANMAAGIGAMFPTQNKWHGAILFGVFVATALLQYFINSSPDETIV